MIEARGEQDGKETRKQQSERELWAVNELTTHAQVQVYSLFLERERERKRERKRE